MPKIIQFHNFILINKLTTEIGRHLTNPNRPAHNKRANHPWFLALLLTKPSNLTKQVIDLPKFYLSDPTFHTNNKKQ